MEKHRSLKRGQKMAHHKNTPPRPPLHVLLDVWIFHGLFGLLMLAPLMFGSVEPWSIFVLEAGVALLCVMWTVQQASSSEITVRWNLLFAPMLVFAALILIQIVTGRTTYRFDTIRVARLYCAYGALCFLVVQLLQKRAQLKLLAMAFTAYGFGVAAFGLVQSFTSGGELYWYRAPRQGGSIYGPYVNRSHYAGLMEMLVPIPLILSFSRYPEGNQRTLARVAAVLMASTIFLSQSRGGMVAFVVQMAVLGVILAREKRGRTAATSLGIFLVLVAGMLVWLGGSELNQRLISIHAAANTEIAGGTRLDIYRDALNMFPQKPILGWGLGAFPEVYPRYRTFYTNLYINEAHNDYLQLLVEMGALGFLTMLWFIGAMYFRALKKIGNWADDPNGTLALIAMLGVTGILVHSVVDFNLQIPANAALFYVMCTVAALDARFTAPQRRLRMSKRDTAPALVVR
ncbi:MAG TPA: O-antigen ligase family protein [Terriglobales bacterium]|jgi:O-antigen ligase|nr:O-antigen ligase family protein [Terriglobales bacterium]